MDEELPLEAALNQSWASLCNLKEEIVWTVHRTAASAAIFQRERACALSQKIIIIKDVCSAGAEKFSVTETSNDHHDVLLPVTCVMMENQDETTVPWKFNGWVQVQLCSLADCNRGGSALPRAGQALAGLARLSASGCHPVSHPIF